MPDNTPQDGFRTFIILWLTQSVSLLGNALVLFANTIWLTNTLFPRPEQKPQLAMALSLVGLAFAIPMVVCAPIAGAWADRHDRKRTMIAADTVGFALTLVWLALLLSGRLGLWSLAALTAAFATCGAFHAAAFDTSYAMLVPPRQLPRANGMMQTSWALSNVLSPGLAAGLISLPALVRQGRLDFPGLQAVAGLSDGMALVICLDTVSFFLSSVILVFLAIPSPKREDLSPAAGRGASMWQDIRVGGEYILRRPPLVWLLITIAVANFAFAPMGVFQPLFVKFNLAADWSARGFTMETALATLGTAFGLGGVAGGIVVSVWGGLKTGRVYGVLVTVLLSGLGLLVFGLSSSLYLSAGMEMLAGFMAPIMASHSQAIWQFQTPHELQGRVFAVRRFISGFTFPLATALAGWVGAAFNPGLVLAVLGGGLALFTAFQFFNNGLLRVEDKEWLDRLAAEAAPKPG